MMITIIILVSLIVESVMLWLHHSNMVEENPRENRQKLDHHMPARALG
jgi:hypothetical protein